jgi:hypothetical protein
MTRIFAIATLLFVTSGAAFAQEAQYPPTDPQSKRQQENPAVNGYGPSDVNRLDTRRSTFDTNETTLTPGSDPISRTSPAGGEPALRTDKAGPLQEKN